VAAAATMAHLARLPLPATGHTDVCCTKLATVMLDTGEQCRCSSGPILMLTVMLRERCTCKCQLCTICAQSQAVC
jgi:hypothetical protein